MFDNLRKSRILKLMKKFNKSESGIGIKAFRSIALRGFSLGFAFFLAFASPLSFSNLLICFEADGAVHVESLDTSDCVNKENPADPFIQVSAIDCHNCTDVAIGSTDSIDKTSRGLLAVANSSAGESAVAFRFDMTLSGFTKLPLSPESNHNDLFRLGTVRILV